MHRFFIHVYRRTVVIRANKETPALTRRNPLLERKDAGGEGADALLVEDAGGGGGGAGEGDLDGEAVAGHAGLLVESGEGAGVGDGRGGGGDVAEGGLDEDAAGEEGDVAGCEGDGLVLFFVSLFYLKGEGGSGDDGWEFSSQGEEENEMKGFLISSERVCE